MKLESFLFVAVIIMGEAQEINLESWMKDLPERLKDMPFIYLAIPGSHDSMTYGINRSSGLAPDAEPIMHRLYPLFRGTIIRWTVTQGLDASQQLLMGIRYLDLRVATKTNTDKFFFTHGLYADEISKALNQVKDFVSSHPEEVVILDFQHFYGFGPEEHPRLTRYLLNLFGARLAPRQPDLRAVTLRSLARLGQQIIVVYRSQFVYATSEFWQPQMLPSPWPRQERAGGLVRFLEAVKRHPGTGFVHQAVLTPTASFIVLRWASSLRAKCAAPVVKDVLPKLAEFSPGPPSQGGRAPVNVVIADFVDMADAIFPKTIIRLNHKLTPETPYIPTTGEHRDLD